MCTDHTKDARSEPMADAPDPGSPRFYHGTKADLGPGDLIELGQRPDAVRPADAPAFVFLSSSFDAAAWEAELMAGDGPGRIYIVEPTGPIADGPDPARNSVPWPAKVYRSEAPLRITGEATDRHGRPLRFYHGTKADLVPGDLIEPGHASNFGERDRNAAHVYLAGTLDAATWGAELAVGDGPGRIYIVEPTGPIEDDPELTNRRFAGNPTKSYRSREPLRVTGEATEWQGHAPEALKAMKDGLEQLKQQGVELTDQ
jgi:rifampin ADP-ribosylating transferase